MTSPAVLYATEGPIGVLTLNRPDNRNSMTPELLDAFATAAERARRDGSIRCLVVTGAGRCFSAGADLRAGLQRADDSRPRQPHERSYTMYEPFLSLLDIEVPVIAAMNGHAVGGGFGMALLCDVRIARRDAKYGANFTRLGLHPGLGISYLLPRLVGASRAAELLFAGRLFDGEEGVAMGLFSAAVEVDEVMPRALLLASEICAAAPYAVRETKRSLYRGLGWDVRGAALDEAYSQAASLETEDAREGVAALLEKREPTFRGR